MRAKLESIQRQTGRDIPELKDLVTLPESMQFIWMWFIELHNSRSSNGFGVNPISYAEIKSYFDLLGIVPASWEVKLIKQLDIVALNAFAEQSKKEQEKHSRKKPKN